MKRFSFDEDDNYEDDDDLEDMKFLMPSSEFISMGSTEQDLLGLAIRVCEKSWFWKFYGAQKKIEIVQVVFEKLRDIIEDGEQDATL